MIELFPHQRKALELTKDKSRCAYFLDMGLGKTFVASEKARLLSTLPIIVVCPKSMIRTWIEHYTSHYNDLKVADMTKKQYDENADVFVINYDLIWRREIKLKNYTLILDESSYLQNEKSKRTKAILKLKPKNTILLSGTPTGGQYEKLWAQLKLLGWNITKTAYWDRYVNYKELDLGVGFPIKKVTGYKNTDELIKKLQEYGAVFMKTTDVIELPQQVETTIKCKPSTKLRQFSKTGICEVEGRELVADMPLKKLTYSRQLCSSYSEDKLNTLKDIINSTEDRLIIFYNFQEELSKIKSITDKPISIVNGQEKDLTAYEECSNSITCIQYQAGSMGLNLQKANKIIYYSPTLKCEELEQSRKRTHRIGQKNTCFYYYLVAGIEEDIYKVLSTREDYTLKLFEGSKKI